MARALCLTRQPSRPRRPRRLPRWLLRSTVAFALAAGPAAAQVDLAAAIAAATGAATPGAGAVLDDGAAPSPFGELPPPTPLGEGDNTGFQLLPGERLELHARNLAVADAMAQLRQLVRRNIIVAPEVTATFTGDLYDVDVLSALTAICRSAHLVFRDEGDYLWIEPALLETRIYELHHSRAVDLVELVRPLLSKPDGSVSGTEPAKQGIPSDAEETGGDDFANRDVFVVRDYPDVLASVDALVAAVDALPKQVLIEATILTAELRTGLEAGVDLLALSGVDFADVGGVSTAGDDLDIGPIDGDTLDEGLGKLGTGLGQSIDSHGLNLALARSGVAGFIRAVESITNTTVLANPKILTVNKQRGEVLLGRRDGYQTSIVSQTSTTEKVEFLETGTRLVFRPFVLADGFVRLEIHPEDSDGGINDEGLPFKETAEVTSNILVRDGQTVAIGGLFRERVGKIHEQVPWLGDIPVLGWLFQSVRDTVIREEIIVLVTPRIIDLTKDPSALAGGLGLPLDHPLAAGLQPWELPADVDPAVLARTYLDTGHELLARGQAGAAALLADVADTLGTDPQGALALRQQAWATWLGEATPAVVDDRILRLVLDGPALHPGAAPRTVEDLP